MLHARGKLWLQRAKAALALLVRQLSQTNKQCMAKKVLTCRGPPRQWVFTNTGLQVYSGVRVTEWSIFVWVSEK